MKSVRHLVNLVPVSLLALTVLLGGLAGYSTNVAAWAPRPYAAQPLSAAEQDDLLWMREEEKLARDLYQELNAYWRIAAFAVIAEAEQRHMDAVGARLARYQLADPALPGTGVFSQAGLQDLYDSLLERAKISEVEALRASAEFEELDMVDLQAALANSTHRDIQTVYQHLLAGSQNHLRAFLQLLETYGD